MKTKEENAKFQRMGELVVELLKVAYKDVSFTYDEEKEYYSFSIDGIDYIVSVLWSSTKAGIRDIARQLILEMEIK